MNHSQTVELSCLFARLAVVLAILATTFFVSAAPAQSAAVINRYVSPGGKDTGDCVDPISPCGSIQYALDRAANADVILLSAGTYYEHLNISKSITIERDPAAVCSTKQCVVIDGGQNGRVINTSGAKVILRKITIQNGKVTGESGAGIRNTGDLTLDEVTVNNNTIIATDYNHSGGGIDNRATLTLLNSSVHHNSAFRGGGIKSENGTMLIQNSEIYANTAKVGGGISIPYGTTACTIENTTIRGNSSEDIGAGIHIYDGGQPAYGKLLVLRNVTISGNTSDTGVGGLYSAIQVDITHSTIAMNSGNTVSDLTLTERQTYAGKPHSTISNTIVANDISTGVRCSISDAGSGVVNIV